MIEWAFSIFILVLVVVDLIVGLSLELLATGVRCPRLLVLVRHILGPYASFG